MGIIQDAKTIERDMELKGIKRKSIVLRGLVGSIYGNFKDIFTMTK
jgi:hypothetical protein